MMMEFDPMRCKQGQVVGHVDIDALFGRLAVPIEPAGWYVLQVHPNREYRVMKTFRQRNISAWLPLNTNTQNVTRYRRGYEITVAQQVTSPLITGAIILPDFEAADQRWKEVEGVIGIYRMGDCIPVLRPLHIAQLRQIEAIGNTPKSKRDHKFAIGELVRVTSGPFKSFSARIERLDSPGRLRVGVEIFGRITPIDIDQVDLEKI